MYKVAVITISDRASSGVYEDKAGPAVCQLLRENNYEVSDVSLIPDDFEKIKSEIVRFADRGINMVITTGGTGFALRDVTPEATKAVIDREVPGIAEEMRRASCMITPKGMLSRGVCGIRECSLIINLPGSPKGAVENLESVIVAIGHGLDILNGKPES